MADTKIEILGAYLKEMATQNGGTYDENAAKKDVYAELAKLGISKDAADRYAQSVIDGQQANNDGKQGGSFEQNNAPEEGKEKGKEDEVGGVVTNDPEAIPDKSYFTSLISLNPEDLKLWVDAHAIEGSLTEPPYASNFAKLDNAKWDPDHKVASMKFTDSDNHLYMAPGVVQYAASVNNRSKIPSDDEALTMVLAGMKQGWTFVELKGTPEFQEAMYVACRKLGIETRGYTPTPQAIARANDGCKAFSETDNNDRCYYDYIMDMEDRFPKIKEFAKGHNATEKMVSEYSHLGLGAFGTKYKTDNLDDGIDHTLSKKEQKELRDIEEKNAKKRLEDEDKYFRAGDKGKRIIVQPNITPTNEPKAQEEPKKETFEDKAKEKGADDKVDNKTESKVDSKVANKLSLQEKIKQPYDREHEEVEKELIRVENMEAKRIAEAEKTFSNQTKGTWNALHKKKDLTPEEQKILESEKEYLAYCQANKLDPQKANVPEKYMPEDIKKSNQQARHEAKLLTAMISNCAMMTLASRKKDYMDGKTPELTIGAQMCNDYQAFYKSVEGKSFADKLQASQKVKSNAKEIDTKVNLAYQQQTGESLKWATVYKNAQAKDAATKSEKLAKANLNTAQIAQKRNNSNTI